MIGVQASFSLVPSLLRPCTRQLSKGIIMMVIKIIKQIKLFEEEGGRRASIRVSHGKCSKHHFKMDFWVVDGPSFHVFKPSKDKSTFGLCWTL